MKQSILTKDIVLVLAASFCFMSSPMLVNPLITGFTQSLGASAAMMGMVGGLTNLVSLLCRPVTGGIADRISKYKLGLVGGILLAVACLGYVTAVHPAVVVAARVVNGFGFVCCTVGMSTWVSNMLPKDKIGAGMGLYGTMNALASAVAPAISVTVYQRLGYRPAFVIALITSAAVVVIIQFVKDRGDPVPPQEPAPAGRPRFRVVDRKVIPIALIIALFTIPYYATQSFLVTYVETRQLDVAVSLFFPAYAVVLVGLRLGLKELFDKVAFGRFVGASCLCASLFLACMAVMDNNLLLILAAVFLAGGYGIMCSVCQSTAILMAAHKENRALANSTYYIGLDLGLSLGPIIGGFLYGGLDIRLFYPVLMVTVPLIALVYFASGVGRRERV